MAKKKSQLSDDETIEQVAGEPVDSSVNPDGITIDPSTEDSKKVTVETDENPVITDSEKPVVEDTTSDNKEPVKLNEFKRFNIRFGYSIDSRSTTTRRTLSTTEIVKQFVKAPTCFIAFETKEDLKDFETLLKIKTIKVEDKEGKLVDFSDAAKKHLVERVTELSKYWIARNSK